MWKMIAKFLNTIDVANLFRGVGPNVFDPRLLTHHRNPRVLEGGHLRRRMVTLYTRLERPLKKYGVDNPGDLTWSALIALHLQNGNSPHVGALIAIRNKQTEDLTNKIRREMLKVWNGTVKACHGCLRKGKPPFVHKVIELCRKCEHDLFEEGSGHVLKLPLEQSSSRKQTNHLFRLLKVN